MGREKRGRSHEHKKHKHKHKHKHEHKHEREHKKHRSSKEKSPIETTTIAAAQAAAATTTVGSPPLVVAAPAPGLPTVPAQILETGPAAAAPVPAADASPSDAELIKITRRVLESETPVGELSLDELHAVVKTRWGENTNKKFAKRYGCGDSGFSSWLRKVAGIFSVSRKETDAARKFVQEKRDQFQRRRANFQARAAAQAQATATSAVVPPATPQPLAAPAATPPPPPQPQPHLEAAAVPSTSAAVPRQRTSPSIQQFDRIVLCFDHGKGDRTWAAEAELELREGFDALGVAASNDTNTAFALVSALEENSQALRGDWNDIRPRIKESFERALRLVVDISRSQLDDFQKVPKVCDFFQHPPETLHQKLLSELPGDDAWALKVGHKTPFFFLVVPVLPQKPARALRVRIQSRPELERDVQVDNSDPDGISIGDVWRACRAFEEDPKSFRTEPDGEPDVFKEYDEALPLDPSTSLVEFSFAKFQSLGDVSDVPFDPAPEAPYKGVPIFPPQKQVASILFDRLLAVLGLSRIEDLRSSFNNIEFVLFTAGYVSLREQTRSRLTDFGLDGNVFITHKKYVAYASSFFDKALAVENQRTLFVMVCDEAHWGINKSGAYDSVMNGTDSEMEGRIRGAPNIVQLLVSATPYNLITRHSRISPGNEVRWSDAIQEATANSRFFGESSGKHYVGLNDFLRRCKVAKGLNEKMPLRQDDRFEQLVVSTKMNPVDALAADYALSICIAHVVSQVGKDPASAASRWKQWEDAKEKMSSALRKVFNKALDKTWTSRSLEEAAFVESRCQSFPESETDHIIADLMSGRPCMKVVRIAPGEDCFNDIAGNSAEKALALKRFLEPIRGLLFRLNNQTLLRFAVIGDFGKTNPGNGLCKKYPKLWARMQSTNAPGQSLCRGNKGKCACTEYKQENGSKKCANCGHIHRNFETYEDLGGIPLLLVIVLKARLGDTFPASFDMLDMRVTKRKPGSSKLSTLVQELGRLCRFSDREPGDWSGNDRPNALISEKLEERLLSANGDYRRIDLDADYFACTRALSSVRECEKVSVGKRVSMDEGRPVGDFWRRRLLLSAEPQIGKTGAFLQFLLDLKLAVCSKIPLVPVGPTLPVGTALFPLWFFPHSKLLKGSLSKYNIRAPNKYHAKLGELRRSRWEKARQDVRAFARLTEIEEGPLSDKGIACLSELMGKPAASVEDAINWDGVFSHGAQDPRMICDLARGSCVSITSKPVRCTELGQLSAGSAFRGFSGMQITGPRFNLRVQIPAHLLETDIDDPVIISVPSHLSDLFLVSGDAARLSQKGQAARWVFVPSYRPSAEWLSLIGCEHARPEESLPHPEGCFLDWSHVYIEGCDTKPLVQVVIVRREQAEAYRKQWPNVIVLQLPSRLCYGPGTDSRFKNLVTNAGKDRGWIEVWKGGVGYARLVGQVVAHALGIDMAFFFDDNVVTCTELQDDVRKDVPFSHVMDHMEAIMRCDRNTLSKLLERREDLLEALNRTTGTSCASLAEYAGSPLSKSCGILGMQRAGQRIVKGAPSPFIVTLNYSAFLLNVKATIEKGALFPARPLAEDIEFGYICEDVGLKSLKCNRFAHAKPFSHSGSRVEQQAAVDPIPAELPAAAELFAWTCSTSLKFELAEGDAEPSYPSEEQLEHTKERLIEASERLVDVPPERLNPQGVFYQTAGGQTVVLPFSRLDQSWAKKLGHLHELDFEIRSNVAPSRSGAVYCLPTAQGTGAALFIRGVPSATAATPMEVDK